MAGPSAPNVIDVNIAITDDIVTLEDTETYEVHLRIVGFAPNVEIGRHEITTVNVLDDDGESSSHLPVSVVLFYYHSC